MSRRRTGSVTRPFRLALGLALMAVAPHAPGGQAKAKAAEARHLTVIKAIAAEIEALKTDYPQLAEFSAARNLVRDALEIVYVFHTHSPPRTGGWTSGVPHPDDDGVWFALDFHDPRSTLEKHTQPKAHEKQCFGDMQVQLLMLEGKKTRPLNGPIWKILRKHGVEKCPPAPRTN